MGATDSKLAIRKGVFRLYEEKSIAVTEEEFWSLFWTLPESADDVFSLIGANDIRQLRDSSKQNLETLIDKLMEKMELVLNAHNFPSEANSINHLLNCCRVLTRLIPFIFEDIEHKQWEEDFFWKPMVKENADTSPLRGELLLKLTIQTMFLAGFTLPISMATKETKIVYTIWENGVGSSVPISSYKDNEANRTEVLRLFSVLLSKSMYVDPSNLLSAEDKWLQYVASKTTDRKIVLVTLCSLINTVCNYDPTGWVPYNHVLLGDPREHLVTYSLTVLLILLDYRSPEQVTRMRQNSTSPISDSPVIDSDSNSNYSKPSVELEVFSPEENNNQQQQTRASSIHDNVFRYYMSKLHRKQDFDFLMDGLYRILMNPLTASNTYLPRSTKKVQCYMDVMMLCWRLIETNSRFVRYLVETDRALDLTVLLIFHAADNKENIAQLGLVRICAFMLQTLSSNKEYSIKLNKTFTTHSSLPSIIRLYAFNGSYADFLIISIFSLIASTHGTLSSLYPALMLTLSNVSPYLKNLGVTTASKLMSLFHSMSSASFLLADENNYQLTTYLLETLNHVIHHQYESNPNLVYSVVLHHDYFEKLSKFNLNHAIAEVERKRLARSQIKSSEEEQENKTEDQKSADQKDGQKEEQDQAVNEEEQATAKTEEVKSIDKKEENKEEEESKEEKPEKEIQEAKEAQEETQEETKEETLEETNEEAKEEEQEDQASEQKEDNEVKDDQKEESSSSLPQASSSSSPDNQNQESSSASPSDRQGLQLRDSSDTNFHIETSFNGFVPSQAWAEYWQKQLPLKSILTLVGELVPKIEEKCSKSNPPLEELMAFIQSIEIDNLPEEESHVFIRQFKWGEALVIWFRSMMWGQSYVTTMKEYGAWNGTHVQLFQIKQQLQ